MQFAVFPFFVLTVIIAVPGFMAVTLPLLTVATLLLLLIQVTDLFLALAGANVEVNNIVPPI